MSDHACRHIFWRHQKLVARCVCGWEGPPRYSSSEAERDALRHQQGREMLPDEGPEAERDALAARVEELEARIARALDKVCVIASPNRATHEQPGDCMVLAAEARRILRGEDEDDGAPEAR